MNAFIATDILSRFLKNLPNDIAIFIYDYYTGKSFHINANVEEKDWYKGNSNNVDLTSVYENGVETRFSTTFQPETFKEQALDAMDDVPDDETLKILMGTSVDAFEDDLVSYVMLIYHSKCKLGLAEIVLEALRK